MDEELFQLVRAAISGDTTAYSTLVKHYQKTVFLHAYAMLHDRAEAEDVSQEAFVKAYYSLEKLESEYAFSSWLTRIVSNLCYDRFKKMAKQPTLMEQPLDENIPSRSMETAQIRINLEESMAKLSTEHREVIVLRDIQGFSYDEMAKILQIPVGTVKSRVHLARLALRNQLTE